MLTMRFRHVIFSVLHHFPQSSQRQQHHTSTLFHYLILTPDRYHVNSLRYDPVAGTPRILYFQGFLTRSADTSIRSFISFEQST